MKNLFRFPALASVILCSMLFSCSTIEEPSDGNEIESVITRSPLDRGIDGPSTATVNTTLYYRIMDPFYFPPNYYLPPKIGWEVRGVTVDIISHGPMGITVRPLTTGKLTVRLGAYSTEDEYLGYAHALQKTTEVY